MDKQNSQLSNSPAWNKLQSLAESYTNATISELFTHDPDRVKKYSIDFGGLYLDYSKNSVDDVVMQALQDLAESSSLVTKRQDMFDGKAINVTEHQAAWHTALRNPDLASEQIASDINQQLSLMQKTSDAIRSGEWRGSTGKDITDVVNIGIGGSDLGPKMVCTALAQYAHQAIATHFISNVDGAEIHSLLNTLDAQSTLFVVSSKTFTTQETLLNTRAALNWLENQLNLSKPENSSHLIAITAAPEKAIEFGVNPDRILTFWPFVGGRYSIWSSIGLSISIAIGHKNFEQLLAGARKMDQHFLTTELSRNMPVILALLGIWYNNFLGCQSQAVIPYCERLAFLPAYLQQLDMESNGKSTTVTDQAVDYQTGPVIWGQTGTNGQHAFFQLLHQGTKTIPVDFIAPIKENLGSHMQHQVLLTNMIAQSAALMTGEANADLHKNYPGNKPSSTLLLDELTPFNLGALLALYEHKIFVQGAIWNINSFDQWGVELGKRLANSLLGEAENLQSFDPSSQELARRSLDLS